MASTALSWWRELQFEFNPTARTAGSGEILVGLGNPYLPNQAGIVLNPKFVNSPFRSVTQFVRHADTQQIKEWRMHVNADWKAVKRVVLEDLSLDTCFALLLFNRLLSDTADKVEMLDDWCAYVSRWEEGYVREEGSPKQSVAVLITTLGHSFFALDASDPQQAVDADQFDAGAKTCLTLLADMVAQSKSPGRLDMAALPASDARARARSHVEYELEQYRLALERACICQLSVPLRGSGREMLVDALFVEERVPSALLKVFARNDRKHSWTRRGFEVLGLYRPALAGTGNDMVISVAKESGLSLEQLWRKLEEGENTRWGDERPSYKPREIKSYAGRTSSPNEPWWDDHGDYTLIAAPKAVQIAGCTQPGTRLSWSDDVLPAIWTCYNPIPRENLTIERLVADVKVLTLCRWNQKNGSLTRPVFAADCPTFYTWLMSMSLPHGEPRSPQALPTEAQYEVAHFDGGYAIVHRNGVTIFDDWREIDLPFERIRAVFDDILQVCTWMEHFNQHGLGDTLEFLQSLSEANASFNYHKFETWQIRTGQIRTELLTAGAKILNSADPWPFDKFRALVSQMFGVNEKRRDTLAALDQIDRAATEISKYLRERRQATFRAIGAGLALAFTFKEVVDLIRENILPNTFEWAVAMFVDQPRNDDWLRQQVEAAHNLELMQLIFVALGFVAGYGLSRWFDQPLSH